MLFIFTLASDEGDFKDAEISCVEYVEISRNKYSLISGFIHLIPPLYRFIISAGWDRAINVYIDQCDPGMHRNYPPQPRWIDDLTNGHNEDILTLATLKGHLLATADYHGTIIVWNLMSGHIFFKLSPPVVDLDEDTDYSKIVHS